ncbi:hypothetical protein [Latilactobacillus curvatus]|uniref:hypothetical protein n=1 Tax=Latilactobacillus curvatus TaxID=28038 RepID=UPI000F7D047E|nr:hypothetical protein [Latilactobacillus curvatus]AZP96129.1 hypothetical protein CYK59_03805 [Latilactobacillus curvatus]
MSKPYMISYDLNSPGQKYEKVKEVIVNFGGAYIKPQNSFWLVRNNLTPNEMNDRLMAVTDKTDRIFICELLPNYQGVETNENWEWIKEHIFDI